MSNSQKQNLGSTDYDVSQIKNYDRRFEAGRKDAVFLHTLGFVAVIIATVWMYVFGSGDPASMKYFLGFPIWISGTIVIYLAMFVIGIIYVAKWKVFPFTKRENDGGKKK